MGPRPEGKNNGSGQRECRLFARESRDQPIAAPNIRYQTEFFSSLLVDGTITARTIHIIGTVNGEIVSDAVSLGPDAIVKGNIHYQTLNIATGASLWGLCLNCRSVDLAGQATKHLNEGPPLPFNRAWATCRKARIVHEISSKAKIQPVMRSMKAVSESYQKG